MGIFKDIRRQPERAWDPKYPDAARDADRAVPAETPETPEQEIAEEWVYAPATSHIERMRFEDASTPFARGRGKWRFLSGESRITVVFRPNAKGAGGGMYTYFFADWKLASAIWEDLITSPHPYGECLYPKVIKPKVPYKANWKG